MTRALTASVVLLGVAVAAGVAADQPIANPAITIGGYRVLAADFHVHTSLSGGALTPLGLILEARRQHLDAVAITGHNEMISADIAEWIAPRITRSIVIPGQEILHYEHHLMAIGTRTRIDSGAPLIEQIAAIHRQGGVAIAAHPGRFYGRHFDAAAVQALDAAEICHPSVFTDPGAQTRYEEFAARGHLAAIGSSDFHVTGRIAMCRTFVFAREASAGAILDAIRARHTVVYGLNGKAYGDPTLVRLAEADGRLRAMAPPDPPVSALDWISRVFGVFGLSLLVMASANGRPAHRQASRADAVRSSA